MNLELGTFALKQLLNSAAIVGPLFLLVGFFFYVFHVDRRIIRIYLGVGILLCGIGIWCLAMDFKDKRRGKAKHVIKNIKIFSVKPVRK